MAQLSMSILDACGTLFDLAAAARKVMADSAARGEFVGRDRAVSPTRICVDRHGAGPFGRFAERNPPGARHCVGDGGMFYGHRVARFPCSPPMLTRHGRLRESSMGVGAVRATRIQRTSCRVEACRARAWIIPFKVARPSVG